MAKESIRRVMGAVSKVVIAGALGCVGASLGGGACGTPGHKMPPPSGDAGPPADLMEEAVDFAPRGDLAPLPLDDCSEQAKLVYVIDSDERLASFDPKKLKFTDIGKINCGMGLDSPFSMAVDRSAVAWVLYQSGNVFQVDTKTAACKPTAFVPDQQGMHVFGMGFATNALNTTDETLYIAGGQALQPGMATLGSIDLKTLAVSPLGAMDGWPELTGTGDARLWGFFPDANLPRVAQIDKKTGALYSVKTLPAIAGTPSAWAFAFWGGDYWIFLERVGDPSTEVHHMKPNGTLTTPLPDTGRHIVGAGVSTCAPTQIG